MLSSQANIILPLCDIKETGNYNTYLKINYHILKRIFASVQNNLSNSVNLPLYHVWLHILSHYDMK